LPAGQIVGVNVIPGAEESQSAYQSELGGVTGILEALHCIYRAHNITYGKVEVGLDGDQARKEAFGTWPLGPSRPDFDLIVHIRGRMIRLSPWGSRPDGSNHTKIILSHSLHSAAGKTERGMRRSCQKLLELECFSKLLASQHPVWSQEMGTMNQQEETVGSRQKKGFMPLPLRSVRKSTGTKKSSFPPELITSINWEACTEAMGRLPFGKKWWLLKHATGWCGVGRRELLWGNPHHDECPRCGKSESSRHVVECKGTGADLTFALAVKKLETALTALETAPSITKIIIKRV
jgi:hypothetical protein